MATRRNSSRGRGLRLASPRFCNSVPCIAYLMAAGRKARNSFVELLPQAGFLASLLKGTAGDDGAVPSDPASTDVVYYERQGWMGNGVTEGWLMDGGMVNADFVPAEWTGIDLEFVITPVDSAGGRLFAWPHDTGFALDISVNQSGNSASEIICLIEDGYTGTVHVIGGGMQWFQKHRVNIRRSSSEVQWHLLIDDVEVGNTLGLEIDFIAGTTVPSLGHRWYAGAYQSSFNGIFHSVHIQMGDVDFETEFSEGAGDKTYNNLSTAGDYMSMVGVVDEGATWDRFNRGAPLLIERGFSIQAVTGAQILALDGVLIDGSGDPVTHPAGLLNNQSTDRFGVDITLVGDDILVSGFPAGDFILNNGLYAPTTPISGDDAWLKAGTTLRIQRFNSGFFGAGAWCIVDNLNNERAFDSSGAQDPRDSTSWVTAGGSYDSGASASQATVAIDAGFPAVQVDLAYLVANNGDTDQVRTAYDDDGNMVRLISYNPALEDEELDELNAYLVQQGELG